MYLSNYGKFEIFKDRAGEYRFRLKAPNGQIIAVSEGYTTKTACKNGIEAVKRYASTATVSDLS
ncbi:YegP family protein [Brassicibacter mesophilus]|uniref:YegP family protein n=1 Tax=Brassicibacter mesophilus TaxID=745119 RepID=UPI003D1E4CCA